MFFPCEFCEIFENTFYRTSLVTASVSLSNFFHVMYLLIEFSYHILAKHGFKLNLKKKNQNEVNHDFDFLKLGINNWK